jgi:hypothetical protein
LAEGLEALQGYREGVQPVGGADAVAGIVGLGPGVLKAGHLLVVKIAA